MKIRRYYGHDCNSNMGFNDGYYVDSEPIEVKDETEAMEACLKALSGLRGIPLEDLKAGVPGLSEDDDGYTLITMYSDDEGNSITAEQYAALNENEEAGGYLYVFVNYQIEGDPQ